MKTIEVEWEVKPKSGITTIDVTDLVKTEADWNRLSKKRQEELINTYLIDSDGYSLKALAKQW